MKPRTLQVISLIVALCGGLFALDAVIQKLGFIDPRISQWWPLILAGSSVISRIAAILADFLDDGEINQSWPKTGAQEVDPSDKGTRGTTGLLVLFLASALLVLGLSGCQGLPPREYSIYGRDREGNEAGLKLKLGSTRLDK